MSQKPWVQVQFQSIYRKGKAAKRLSKTESSNHLFDLGIREAMDDLMVITQVAQFDQ